jgi:hypothetical protein
LRGRQKKALVLGIGEVERAGRGKMREKSRLYCLGGPPLKQFYAYPEKVWALI